MISTTVFFVTLGALLTAAQSSPSASPVGETFPSVEGKALSGERVRIPEDLSGSPAVLLVAYRRGTQPDIDRWIELLNAEVPEVRFLEVPTIANPAWRPMASWIDSGMRGGVPKEMWSRVVTLYKDAGKVKEFLGDSGGHRTHVVLLDRGGRVAWFDASGYGGDSARALIDEIKVLKETSNGR